MKPTRHFLLICVLIMALVVTGCGGKKSDNGNADNNGNNGNVQEDRFQPKGDPNLTGKVTIWSLTPHIYEAVVPGFKKHFPNVEVEVIPQGFDIAQKVSNAIYAGKGGPDIVGVIHGMMAQFSTMDAGFEDLLQAPYNAGQYEQYYTKGDWARWHTLDGKLLAMPLNIETRVTYYRTDIMEDYGYPSDPDEFGEYIQNKENYLNMAETLKQDGKYLINHIDEIFYWYMENQVYDRELNLHVATDQNVEALNIAKEMYSKGYAPQVLIGFSDDANQMLATGVFAAVPSGGSGMKWMHDYAPETKGKWGAAPLPFGANLTSTGSGSAILAQSKNKEAAWAFLQYMHTTYEGLLAIAKDNSILFTFKPIWDVPEYVEYEDEFLANGQELRKVALEIIDKAEPIFSTPLDAVSNQILKNMFDQTLEQNLDSLAALKKAEDDILAANSQQHAELLKKIQQ